MRLLLTNLWLLAVSFGVIFKLSSCADAPKAVTDTKSAVATAIEAQLTSVVSKDDLTKMTPEQAFEALKAGNQRFVEGKSRSYDFNSQVKTTAMGQNPPVIVVGCMDSRTAPEIVFNQGLGDIFTVRIAGAFLTKESLGSLEYACQHVGTKLIVLMPHSQCGAVKGLIGNEKPSTGHKEDLGNLKYVFNELTPALKLSKAAQKDYDKLTDDDKCALIVKETAEANAKEILADSPIIAKMVAEKKVKIVTGVYDIATGKVNFNE